MALTLWMGRSVIDLYLLVGYNHLPVVQIVASFSNAYLVRQTSS